MNYRIKLSKDVAKFLKNCDKHIAVSFWDKAVVLSNDPYNKWMKLDITPMAGTKDVFRMRIGKYRFLYAVSDTEAIIIFTVADSRGGDYKK